MKGDLQIHKISRHVPLDTTPPLLETLIQLLKVLLHVLNRLLNLVIIVGLVAESLQRNV